MGRGPLRIQALALDALQEASEVILVQIFEDAYIFTMHARRSTTNPADFILGAYFNGKAP